MRTMNVTARGWGRVCALPARLFGRVRLPIKFALIGVALVIPLAFVIQRYTEAQDASAAFSDLEATGVAFVEPAIDLELALVDARTHAASGDPVDSSAVQAAMSTVDESAASIGDAIVVTDAWSTLRNQIGALLSAPPTDAGKAFEAWT